MSSLASTHNDVALFCCDDVDGVPLEALGLLDTREAPWWCCVHCGDPVDALLDAADDVEDESTAYARLCGHCGRALYETEAHAAR